MKLIVATIQDQDAGSVLEALTALNIRVTHIGSTGGFLQKGNTTLLIGVAEELVDVAVGSLKANSKRRTEFTPMATASIANGGAFYNYIEVEVGGATAFVLDVEQFIQL